MCIKFQWWQIRIKKKFLIFDLKVWDKRAWSDGDVEPVGVFAGHRDGVTHVDSRQDERYLLSNSKDQTIKVWDLRKFSNMSGVVSWKKCWNYFDVDTTIVLYCFVSVYRKLHVRAFRVNTGTIDGSLHHLDYVNLLPEIRLLWHYVDIVFCIHWFERISHRKALDGGIFIRDAPEAKLLVSHRLL